MLCILRTKFWVFWQHLMTSLKKDRPKFLQACKKFDFVHNFELSLNIFSEWKTGFFLAWMRWKCIAMIASECRKWQNIHTMTLKLFLNEKGDVLNLLKELIILSLPKQQNCKAMQTWLQYLYFVFHCAFKWLNGLVANSWKGGTPFAIRMELLLVLALRKSTKVELGCHRDHQIVKNEVYFNFLIGM